MRWLHWRAKSRDRDLEDEIAYDLAAEAEDHAASGMSRDEAARRSRQDFGNLLLVKEATREMWGLAWFERLAQDLKYGLRTMRRNAGFTVIAVLSLALGIGANTAIYSFMDAILLRSLPVRDPQSLVAFQWRSKAWPEVIHGSVGGGRLDPKQGFIGYPVPYPMYEFLSGSPVLSQTFGFASRGQFNLQARGQADIVTGYFVSGTFFGGLGLAPAAGRLLGPDDDRAGAPPVVVLSYQCATARFGEVARAPGQTVRIDNGIFEIVGVAPAGFFGMTQGTPRDIYLPLRAAALFDPVFGANSKEPFVNPNYYWVQVFARLRPGVSRRQAAAALAPVFHNFVASTASTAKERADLPALLLNDGAGGLDTLRRTYSEPLYVLMAMSGLILALACANIANLLLARATARRREMAVRLSVGAGRARVVRQLLTESVLLASAGGLAGLVFAKWGIGALTLLLSGGKADATFHATLNWHVLAVATGLSVATGLLFGLAPALAATRVDLIPALKQVRSGQRLHLHRWVRISLGQALVVAQIAISVLLVVAGGLCLHTLANLYSVDLGFNQQRLLLFTVNARQAGYTSEQALRLYDDLQSRFRSIPGVRSASASSFALVGGGMGLTDSFTIPGYTGKKPSLALINVAPGFFTTMQLPILLGREIEAHDLHSASPVAVVNEVFARTFFAGVNPVGRTFDQGKIHNIEIIGVARNARYNSLMRDLPPLAYYCYSQRPGVGVGQMTYELRAASDPMVLAGAVRQFVHEADPRIPVKDIQTQQQQIDSTISQERTFATLCACFAALAVLIACVGLYGTMAYSVARRTNGLGIRMALGAARGQLLWMVLREVLALCAAGLAIGIPLAFAGSRLVESYLFQMKAHDPLTLWLAPTILIAAALAAGYGPAWRASRIDPWSALRDE